MIILVSGATASVRRWRGADGLGVLFVPRDRNDPAAILWPGCTWAADNGAFSNFDGTAFVAMLEKLRGRPGCRFVAAPDVVGDADTTAQWFATWAPMIRALGFPVALVAQDGLTVARVPWGELDALFIGGTTEFKLGPVARDLASHAQARGKWVHMGRVNTRSRFHYAERIGCSSVDGSQFSRWPDFQIPRGLAWRRPLPLFMPPEVEA